ncbi:MAG: hypothetical protein ACI9TY_000196 [Alphaproteobacteria bacterium]|jgi:hypothetical protein
MFFKTTLLTAALALFLFSAASFADDSETQPSALPTFLIGMPTYEVKLTTAKTLPQASFNLTKRAMRILPKFILEAKEVKKDKVKTTPLSGKIELIHSDDKQYCESKIKMCWPKHIEASNGFLTVTSWSGDKHYYKDSMKLATYLWRETGNPMQEIITDKDRR